MMMMMMMMMMDINGIKFLRRPSGRFQSPFGTLGDSALSVLLK
jgi:hypothetical protein